MLSLATLTTSHIYKKIIFLSEKRPLNTRLTFDESFSDVLSEPKIPKLNRDPFDSITGNTFFCHAFRTCQEFGVALNASRGHCEHWVSKLVLWLVVIVFNFSCYRERGEIRVNVEIESIHTVNSKFLSPKDLEKSLKSAQHG